MTMDITKLKPYGSWIVVRPDPVTKVLDSGIYMPDGNLFERIGHSTGTVLAVGPGILNASHKAGTPKYTPLVIKAGDRIVFRGYMQERNRPGGVFDRDYCMLDAGIAGFNYILAILKEGELKPALPYDNELARG
jgi:co-chaperonin GroES (HSP10)